MRIAVLLLALVLPASAESYPIPQQCRDLAKRYGIPGIYSRTQAENIAAALDRYSVWPGVRACRSAIRKEWKL